MSQIGFLCAAAAAAWLGGRAVVDGGGRLALALTVAAVVLAFTIARAGFAARIQFGFVALEIPILLLLTSTLVFRQRGADDLAYNPLDPAAQFRVACVAVAGLLGLMALLSGRHQAARALPKTTTLPFRLFAAYVLVVFIGAPGSVNPTLTAYRGVEFLVAILVFAGARRVLGADAGPRIEATLYWFFVALMISVGVGVVLFPGEAIEPILNGTAPFPWMIIGVFPKISSNGVGTIGVLVAIWSVARVRPAADEGGPSRPLAYTLALLGIATLLFAQYRTGYVALVAAVMLFLVVKARWFLMTAATAALAATLIVAPSFVATAEPYVLRGQTPQEAQQLSGRLEYWSHALPVWERSPIIGRGLVTATRFEVLVPLGFDRTAGIHSTWIEVLVGTGILGMVFFAAAFLTTSRRAVVAAFRRHQVTALVLMTIFAVRSVTGSTFEVFDGTALVFLWIALSLEDPENRRAANPARAG